MLVFILKNNINVYFRFIASCEIIIFLFLSDITIIQFYTKRKKSKNMEASTSSSSSKKSDSEKSLQCKICDKIFCKKSILKRHLQTHSEEKNYKCRHCGKAFKQHQGLIQHLRHVHPKETYTCELCNETISNQNYIDHLTFHRKEKRNTCETCGQSFQYKSELKTHLNTHGKSKCEFCDKIFDTEIFDQHVKNCIIKYFKCKFCERTFKWRNHLKRHIKTNHPKK